MDALESAFFSVLASCMHAIVTISCGFSMDNAPDPTRPDPILRTARKRSRLNETVFDGVRPVVASIMLRTPVLGQILNLIGAVKASPGAMDTALREGKSLSLVSGNLVNSRDRNA